MLCSTSGRAGQLQSLVLFAPFVLACLLYTSNVTQPRRNSKMSRYSYTAAGSLASLLPSDTAVSAVGGAPPFSAEDASPTSVFIKNLLKKHRANHEKIRRGQAPMRAIIARCRGKDVCGGLGDRLFGVVTVFTQALATDRAIFIDHSKPVAQEEFLVPAEIDWRMNVKNGTALDPKVNSALQHCSRTCFYHTLMMPGPGCAYVLQQGSKDEPIFMMNSNHRTECVLKTLLRYNLLPTDGMGGFNRSSEDSLRLFASNFTHHVLNYLFDFSQEVKDIGAIILKNTELKADFSSEHTRECLIGVHVRSGKNTKEKDRHHNVADFGKCAHMVEEQILQAETCPLKKTYWVVISDHPQAPAIVGGSFTKALSTNVIGPIIHVDRSGVGQHLRRGALRLYVDLYMLTRCKYFVASLSTLGEIASIWHGPSVRRYDMEHNKVCSPKPLNIDNWQRDVHIPFARWQNIVKLN